MDERDDLSYIRLKKPKPSFEEDTVEKEQVGLLSHSNSTHENQNSSSDINNNNNNNNANNSNNDSNNDNQGNTNKHEHAQAHPKEKPPPISSVDVDKLFENLDKYTLKQLTPIEALAIFNRTINNLLDLYRITSSDLSEDETDNNEENQFKLNHIVFDNKSNMNLDQHDSSSSLLFANSNDSSVSVQSELSSVTSIPMLPGDLNNNTSSTNSKLEEYSSSLLKNLELPLKKKSRIYSNFEDLMADDTMDNVVPVDTSNEVTPPVEELPKSEGTYLINTCRTYEECTELMKCFYLISLPSLSVEKYLERLNQFLLPSTSIYLTASLYLFNIAFNLKTTGALNSDSIDFKKPVRSSLKSPSSPIKMTPIEPLNVFRLILSAVRVAFKLIEDINHKQAAYCKITGIQKVSELFKLELHFLFLIDFNLVIDEFILANHLCQMRVFNQNMQLLTKKM